MTSIHNLKTERQLAGDIYIGRGSIWGNPFTHIKHKETQAQFVVSSRKEALKQYREYLLNNKLLLSKLHELRDKRLFCWCVPKHKCHGEIIIEFLYSIKTHELF